MKKLMPVLSVREIPPVSARSRRHLPTIRDFIADTPQKDEQQIIKYLKQGVLCQVFPDRGLFRDVLEPENKIDNDLARDANPLPLQPNVMLTDGVWIWPAALIYYVEKYHLRLGPKFVRFCRDKNWQVDKAAIEITDLDLDEFDAVAVTPAV